MIYFYQTILRYPNRYNWTGFLSCGRFLSINTCTFCWFLVFCMAPQNSRGCGCERYSNNCDGYSVQITAKGMFSQQSKVVVAWFRWKLIEKIRKNSQPWCWLPDRKKNCKWLYISLWLRIDWPVVFRSCVRSEVYTIFLCTIFDMKFLRRARTGKI